MARIHPSILRWTPFYDRHGRRKYWKRRSSFQYNGVTILLPPHRLTAVRNVMDHQLLLQKLPAIRAWIENTIAKHSAAARSVLSYNFPRLGKFYSAELLASTFVVEVPLVPMPPLAAWGLSGLEDFETMDPDGITYMNTYFAKPSHATKESLHFHELVHVIQWQHLGPERFLLAYAIGHLNNGYRKNPLESMAYSLQEEFERRTPSFDVAAYVRGKLDSLVPTLLDATR